MKALEKTKAKTEIEKNLERMLRYGRKDPTGWVMFVPVFDENEMKREKQE
jgi:hypothetical protein